MVYAFAMTLTGVVRASVLLFGVSACKPPPAPQEEAKTAPATKAERKPAELSAKCVELAQAICERAPVPCEAASSLFARTKPGEKACVDAMKQLVALDASPLDARSQGYVAVLEQVMRSSASIKKEQLAQNIAQARALVLGGPKRDAQPGDIACPGVSTKKGTLGDELWCEKADGTRHGLATKWNAKKELVRTSEYRAGKLVAVEYQQPASGELPVELFACADGEQLVQPKDAPAGLDVRGCEKDGKRRVSLSWTKADGKLATIEPEPVAPSKPAADAKPPSG